MTRVGPATMRVLQGCTPDGNVLRLTPGTMDGRSWYAATHLLSAAGGTFDRNAGGFVFEVPAGWVLEGLLRTGRAAAAGWSGWYPTPAPVITAMLDAAGLEPGMEVLDACAGEGGIARAAAARGCPADCIEADPGRAAVIRAGGFARRLSVTDFLAYGRAAWEPGWDRVLMDPPAGGGQDLTFACHALELLAAGGMLVSVTCGHGPAAARFRVLASPPGRFIPVPPGWPGSTVDLVIAVIPAGKDAP